MNESRATVSVSACDDYAPEHVMAALRKTLEPLGGMGAFVHVGQTVLIKPNLLSPRPPEECVTTHPALVAAVVTLCREAGAERVWVGDSPAGAHSEEILWQKTGMTDVVSAAGGELKSFTSDGSRVCGDRTVAAPPWIDDVDVIISLPKVKTHILTMLTCALKNTYGLIPGESKSLYHSDFPSPRSMARFLLDVYEAFRPTLHIADGVQALEGQGPANGTPVHVGILAASVDGAALDAVLARLFGLHPKSIPMLRYAGERDIGETDPTHIDAIGDGLERLNSTQLRLSSGRFLQKLPEGVFHLVTWMLAYRPAVDPKLCVSCGICAEICSQDAIRKTETGEYAIDRARCILCMCCMESCPKHAISVRSPFHTLRKTLAKLRRTDP
ncbi:MAG: DUF362 domain-containing protein [Lentisphaeria bacterium]|nr:DUF362 domain-containing protein [Lentisphaeria bacterium]